jgi:BASS family bile acid:Na+ symporter
MGLRQLVVLALQVSIVGVVFGLGLRAAPRDLLYLIRKPGLLFRSLLSVLVIMPIAAVVLTRLFDVRPAAEISLIALAISPVPPLLPKREVQAGGDQAYGLALMVLLALLSIVAVPGAVEILQRVFNRPLGVAPGAISRIVLNMTVLPLLAGMVVRATMPTLADQIDGPVALLVKVLLPLAAAVLLGATWRAIWSAVGGGAVFTMIAFVAVGLTSGHVLGGPDRDRSIVLALSTACRHPAIALAAASANFPEQHVAGTVLLYLLVSALVVTPYLAWQHARAGRSIVL